MIHDATVEVTCDGVGCTESADIEPPYVYGNCRGGGGRYDTSDETIEDLLRETGWVVRDTGDAHAHYCCPECADN